MKAVADREELLVLLTQAARKGNVPAMRILLEESRRDGSDEATSAGIIDELASKRKKAAAST
jgi:hypothetical protein